MKKEIAFKSILPLFMAASFLLFQSCQSSDPIDFSTQIKPILNSRCIGCHGGVKKNGGFSLLFEKEAFADTESGKPAIIRGDASGSEFIRRLLEDDPELRMPYEKPKLSEEEIDLLTRWIDQGAKWGKHWAYSLPEKVEIPTVTEKAGFSSDTTYPFIKNGIDNFIMARLNSEKLRPNTAAEDNIIARRLALDINGIPPSQKLFDAFTKGTLSYEALVDSLLSKKTYGEKWASWWLDMARYADSKGYEKDKGRDIWQYRDWVIRALNNDMPYNQFTIEQLAGDLLPQPSVNQLIATAFHRNTMNNDEGGSDDEEFRVATVLDRTNTTFEVWQSTTIGCVQCHSHPYDPFKHKEYYNLLAFFNNSRDEDTPDESPVLKFYSAEQQKQVQQINRWVSRFGNKKIATDYKNFLQYTEPVYKAHIFKDFLNGSYDDHVSFVLWNNGSCKLEGAYTNNASHIYLNYSSHFNGTKLIVRKNNAQGEIVAELTINKTKGTITRKIPFKKINVQTDLYFETKNNKAPKEVNIINVYWAAFLEDMPGKSEPGYDSTEKMFIKVINTKTPTVPILAENPRYMKRTTQVFERGNWLLKADTVQARTPQSLNSWNTNWPNNRLGLSKWMVDKKNPLTARTLVNRVWHQIFGHGIVSTIEDMGSQSEPPSHPALLDWLALRFMNEHEWSIKSLVKEIVLSGTYRQSSQSNPESYQKDPENKLYARGPRLRLSAEQIRDQALATSGLLSSKMYGPGVMPPQPEGVWETVYNGSKWMLSKGEDRYRRAVYTYLKRTSPYPSFLTFDAGSREVCSIRRTVTNTPLQALVTLNDPVYVEAAYQLAKNMQVPHDIEKSIALSYQKATLSQISETTLKALKELYQISLSEFERNSGASEMFLHFDEAPSVELSALTVVANAIMNLDEFLTKG
ncbi:MAG: PSD1 and planctomycete cytochrome C domain-containing protein [Flavobacteriaceae bacterium]